MFGYTPDDSTTIVVKTAGIGSLRGMWPARAAASTAARWLDLTAIIRANGGHQVTAISVEATGQNGPALPVVLNSGTDGSMVCLVATGGVEPDKVAYTITISFADGSSIAFTAVQPIISGAAEQVGEPVYSIKRGTPLALTLTLQQDDGTPVDLTGATLESQIRDQSGNLVASPLLNVTDAAAGGISYLANSDDTWPIGTVSTDVRVTIGGVPFFSWTLLVDVQLPVTDPGS